MQTFLSGATATEIRDGTKRVPVVLRAIPSERLDLDRLADFTIATAAGPVPLDQLAHLTPQAEEPILWRRDREPFLTVEADVQEGLQAPDVTAAVLPRLASVEATLPSGYRIETGGAAEESAKANTALFAIFPIMAAAMALLLMIQLQNLPRTLLVMATWPLGLIGAVAALLVADQPFGFVAILGVIALGGMIMRNTVILVDQIRQDREAGHDVTTAIVEFDRAPRAARRAHGAGCNAGLHPLVLQRFLGTDGGRDDRWAGGRHRADARLPPGALRARLPRAPARRRDAAGLRAPARRKFRHARAAIGGMMAFAAAGAAEERRWTARRRPFPRPILAPAIAR